MDGTLVKRPSALVPVVMSLAAMATLILHIAMVGTARQADEGVAAHIWQLLMAGQAPIIGYFATRWLPSHGVKALPVLALQVGVALAAVFPVWWFQW